MTPDFCELKRTPRIVAPLHPDVGESVCFPHYLLVTRCSQRISLSRLTAPQALSCFDMLSRRQFHSLTIVILLFQCNARTARLKENIPALTIRNIPKFFKSPSFAMLFEPCYLHILPWTSVQTLHRYPVHWGYVTILYLHCHALLHVK